MKKTNLKNNVLTLTILLALIFGGCSGKSKQEPIAPFSDATWSCSIEEMRALEGDDYSTYESVYGGNTYSYLKDFEGYHGTIKYMYDHDDKLMCIAWAYGCDNEKELLSLYDKVNQMVNKQYGESNYNASNHSTNYGNVWYLDCGDIILSTMITAENKALQYAYLNPLVSNSDKQNKMD